MCSKLALVNERTSKASSIPSSVMLSGDSRAFSTASELYLRMKQDSSVVIHSSSPLSFQNTCQKTTVNHLLSSYTYILT